MGHCRIHGSYSTVGWFSDHDDGCPECANAKELNQAILRRLHNGQTYSSSSKDYGDYTCPHCNYRTLRSGARRCPECHGDPGTEFWETINSREERIWRIKQEDAAAQHAKDERDQFIYLYFLYVLPILIILSQASITGTLSKAHHFAEFVLVLLPLFNWGTAVVLFLTDTKEDIGVVFLVILFWVLIGLLLRPYLRRPKKSS